MLGIPVSVQDILTKLEDEVPGVIWNLQKKQNEFSLTLKWSNSCGKISDPKLAPCDVSRDQPLVVLESEAVVATVSRTGRSKKTKKKSPSAKRRDQRRLQAWKEKRKSSPSSYGDKLTDNLLVSLGLPPRPTPPPSKTTIDATPDSTRGATTVTEPTDIAVSASEDRPTTPNPQDTPEGPLPSVTSVADPGDPDCCFTCGRPESETLALKCCTRCKLAQYCSKNCQISDWKSGHKDQCSALVREGHVE